MVKIEVVCWCGETATHQVKLKLPTAIVYTPVCDKHKMETYDAIKWKLVADGTWIPGALTLELIT